MNRPALFLFLVDTRFSVDTRIKLIELIIENEDAQTAFPGTV